MADINELMKRYKHRLVHVDSRNPSYFLSKLRDQRSIDLHRMWEMFGDTDIDELQFSIENQLSLKFKSYRFNKREVHKIMLDRQPGYRESVRELIPIFTKDDFRQCEQMIAEKSSHDDIIRFISELIDKYDKYYRIKFSAFTKLNRNAKATIKDYGKNDLYLGYPFVEGIFESGKMVRGPLLLHRIELVVNKSDVRLRCLPNESIINPVFITAYMLENDDIKKQLDWNMPTKDGYVEATVQFLKNNYGIDIKNDRETIERFVDVKKSEHRQNSFRSINQFEVIRNAVIGLFPISSRNIYNDLESLEYEQLDEYDTLSTLLVGAGSSFSDQFNETKRPKEQDIKYITPMDWSQKSIVNDAMNMNLVIQGPPGTGKSQTIVNMIANYIIKQKRVLVVSEKVAAINVLYNRLIDLKEHTLIIKDHITDKDSFFSQIEDTYQTLNQSTEISQNDYDHVIENHLRLLQEINEKKKYKGYSFRELLELAINAREGRDVELIRHTTTIARNKDFENHQTLETYLDGLLSYEKKQSFLQFHEQCQKPIFQEYSVSEIIETARLIKKGASLNLTIYNIKANMENKVKGIVLSDIPDFVNHKPLSSVYKFDQTVTNIWAKKELGYKLASEMAKDIYDHIRRIPDWVGALMKLENCTDIKRCQKIVFGHIRDSLHMGFFVHILKRKHLRQLTKDVVEFYLENKEFINFEVIRMVYPQLTQTQQTVLFQAYVNRIETKKQLKSLLLQSNFCRFTSDKVDKLFDRVENMVDELDLDVLSFGTEISEDERQILEITHLEGVSCEIIRKSFAISMVGDEVLEEVLRLDDYFKKHDQHLEMVKTSMEKKMEQSYKMAYLSLKQMVQNKLRSNDRLFQDVKNLVGQANLKRRKSVKHIAERYSEPLNALYPVMLMTPESVSAILPLKKKLFDVVIFDEASQLFVERAIPSIYRASRIIVSGDSKQLRPTSVFISRYVDSEDIEDVFEDEMTSESALENQSLLEQSEARYKKTTLLYHYRSEYKELIDFSNAAFYDQRLRFASAATGYIEKPIEIINVEDGLWENKANIAEADRTVKLVKEILMLRESNETLGIITFNSSQRELIQDKLIYEESDDITKEMDRINEKTLEDESLFVKNIENVQGDERDIIIFSIGYARNSSGRVVNQFGTLSQVAGENRLNVAITRAKRKIYVIKSIQSNELRGNNKNQGPIRFKQYLQYVEHLNSNNRESVKILLNQISDTRYQKDEIFFDSPFEEEVYEKLVQVLEKRYLVKTQIEIGSFRIDLGIYDRVKEQYIAGIECDGMTYHSSQKAVENDFYRQQYLESRGWRILRIWSTNWWRDRDEEIRVILQKLRDIEKIVDR